MKKIVDVNKAINLSKKLKVQNKKIVLAGGCFDILHLGHVKFLEEAKKQGDILFILLENDENVAKLKGKGRPINSQIDRALILESIVYVDYIVLLEKMNRNKDYDQLISKINPNSIAITRGSGQKIHVDRQAKKINAKVISVIGNIQDKSTSKIAKIILEKFGE